MTDVTAELLPDHPILVLKATQTNRDAGIYNGETLGYRCVECGCMDEDVREIVHEGGCSLAGQTAPHDYAGRRDLEAFPDSGRRPARADGGQRD